MIYTSTIEQRGAVRFPEFAGERIYMLGFTQREGLPSHLRHWQPTVDAMLDGIEAPGDIYLMVDQSPVVAGQTHRRAGIHIDGYWHPGVSAHGGGGHRSAPAHRQYPPTHGPTPRHSAGSGKHGWRYAAFDEPEAIILASDITASRALCGHYAGPVGDGGDCTHLDLSALSSMPLSAGYAYTGNVTCLHESLPVAQDCLRTLVRLNVPGWEPGA